MNFCWIGKSRRLKTERNYTRHAFYHSFTSKPRLWLRYESSGADKNCDNLTSMCTCACHPCECSFVSNLCQLLHDLDAKSELAACRVLRAVGPCRTIDEAVCCRGEVEVRGSVPFEVIQKNIMPRC